MWKYEVANTDHSLMQGVELVNRLIMGEPETTIGMTYTVTTDGRNAAVHERPAHAGSGEKRLAAAATTAPITAPITEPKPVGDLNTGEVSEDELAIGDGRTGQRR